MAVTAKVYTNAQKHLDDDTDWASDTIKVRALTSSYTPSQAHEFASDLTNELGTANGYTAGGATVTGKSRSVDTASRRVRYKAGATTWTPSAGQTLTIRYLVYLKDTGSDATSPVLAYVDLGADVQATGAAWTTTPDTTDGVFYVEAA